MEQSLIQNRVMLLRRKTNYRDPKKVVILVCQGAETEPIYFNNFRKKDCDIAIHIHRDAGKDPIAITKTAKYLKNDQYKGAVIERIFCIYDVDNTPETVLKKSYKISIDNGLETCISNPCFEIWYLLHFLYSTSRYNSYDDVNMDLINHVHGYAKNKDIFNLLLPNQQKAIANAKRLEKHHKDVNDDPSICGSNPSTQIFIIVEYLNQFVRM